MDHKTFRKLALGILEDLKPTYPEDRLIDAEIMITHGESKIALENICSNIHEFDISISRKLFDSIKELGSILNLNPSDWQDIEHLVKKD
ncbi:MAG: MafI family immunity protein [Proteobacteria bacterium]|nr:MAG: MafI family immunity protein [Pseudomonadota bacterium]